MLALAPIKKRILTFCLLIAFLIGLLLDLSFDTQLDAWLHDAAIVYQSRTEWEHSGIVVLDDDVPFSVGRKQSLPLFALATERLVATGANGVFLDARVPKEIEGRMPYARCIETDGDVRWSMPSVEHDAQGQCSINNSELGNAPLAMDAEAIQRFRVAPYLDSDNNLPDFLLFGWEGIIGIPEQGLVVSDRLITYNSPVGKWLDLSHDHAVYQLVKFNQPDKIEALYKPLETDVICEDNRYCRRLRLSRPLFTLSRDPSRLILPVSELASCDETIGLQAAAQFKDKVVILQTAAPNESTDRLVSIMTTAWFGPELMTPGGQYLIDAVETIINQDSPQPPEYWIKLSLFVFASLLGIVAGLFQTQFIFWLLGIVFVSLLVVLCFINPLIQLWPVFASLVIYTVAAGQLLLVRLFLGFKEGKLVRQYIPRQIHQMLISLRKNEQFQSQRRHVAVLMSDLAGYTTVTGLLKEPDLVLDLMNDYLNETSFILQQKYDGILEAYVGDLVCYYWAENSKQDRQESYKRALLGAIDLRELQKKFFLTLHDRYENKIDEETLQQIIEIIDAGIGITAGKVVMGNLGPEQGIQKFGILGDPLNLAARMESLTRLFNTDIIVAGELLSAIDELQLAKRRLGTIKVKGRVLPETLYAMGRKEEFRFHEDKVQQWQSWVAAVESGTTTLPVCPDEYALDKATIEGWLQRGLLSEDGIWQLDKK